MKKILMLVIVFFLLTIGIALPSFADLSFRVDPYPAGQEPVEVILEVTDTDTSEMVEYSGLAGVVIGSDLILMDIAPLLVPGRRNYSVVAYAVGEVSDGTNSWPIVSGGSNIYPFASNVPNVPVNLRVVDIPAAP